MVDKSGGPSQAPLIVGMFIGIGVLILIAIFFNPITVAEKARYGDKKETTIEEKDVEKVELSLNEKSLFGIPFKEEYITVYFTNGEAEVFDKPDKVLIDKGDNNLLTLTGIKYPDTGHIANETTELKLDEKTYTEFYDDYVTTFKRTPNKSK